MKDEKCRKKSYSYNKFTHYKVKLIDKERKEETEDYKKNPGLYIEIKTCLSNSMRSRF